jgi:S1-C subfamily serine protease
MSRPRASALAALAAALLAHVPAGAATATPPAPASSAADGPSLPAELVERMLAEYVFVGGGSGVLVSSDGVVVTNNHVIDGEDDLTVRTHDGLSWPSTLLGTDPVGDIAVLRIDPAVIAERHRAFAWAEFAPAEALVPAIPVVAVGNPFALGDFDDIPTVTAGVLNTGRIVRGDYTDAVQADAPVNPGNSGGPLFDLHGRLLGINGQIRSLTGYRINSGIGLAVDAPQLAAFVPLLEKADGGYVRHTAAPKDLKLSQGDQGVMVAAHGASPLQDQDLLISIDGRPAASVAAAMGEFCARPAVAGAAAKVLVKRGAVEITVLVPLGHTPIPGHPYHGIEFEEDEGNLIIEHVDSGSPADAAGVGAGDTVTAVAGTPAEGKISVLRAMLNLEVGDHLVLTLRTRDGGKRTVAVLLKQHA